MLRVIREIKPKYIVGENVAGLLSWSGGLVFDEVHSDLEAEGYEVQAVVIPAAAVNAPHGRDRVWFVAKNTNENGWRGFKWENESSQRKQRNIGSRNNERLYSNDGKIGTAPHSNSKVLEHRNREGKTGGRTNEKKRTESFNRTGNWQNFPTVSPVCSRNDGLSHQLDAITFSKWRKESIKAAGNAVVPQVVYEIFKAIESTRK